MARACGIDFPLWCRLPTQEMRSRSNLPAAGLARSAIIRKPHAPRKGEFAAILSHGAASGQMRLTVAAALQPRRLAPRSFEVFGGRNASLQFAPEVAPAHRSLIWLNPLRRH